MRTRTIGLLLLVGVAGALEPAEVYARAAPGTVVVEGAAEAAGVVLRGGKGLILTTERAVRGKAGVRVVTRDGAVVDARVVARDTVLDAALLEADLAGTTAKALALAPAWKKETKIAGVRVYAVGHGADATKRWKFHQGVAGSLETVAGASRGLRLLRQDAVGSEERGGGPLLDADGRVVGMTLGAWKAETPGPPATAHALPINAILAFLAAAGVEGFPALPADALHVFGKTKTGPDGREAPDDEQSPAPVDATDPGAPAERVSIPVGLRYGRYLHFLESRERAALERRATRVVRDLRGLHYRCPRCSGDGVIRVVVRQGYTEADGTVVPAVYESRTCPRCEGKRRLFRASVASAAFERYGAPDGAGKASFLAQAHLSGSSFLRQPSIRAEVRGTHGIVQGPRGNALFPLHFVLLPDGRKYEWFLGADTADDVPTAPVEATVAEVAAADILLLDDGTIVRVCGLVVPDARGQALPEDATETNDEVRLAARALILGKRVKLTPDKYARMTCDGHPLVFVEADGQDYGEALLRAGLVRRHTRHKHARNMRYQHAETEAKKADRGIWAE